MSRHSSDGQDRLAGTRVLLVDDSDLARRLLRNIVQPHGCEVVEAQDGMTALERYGGQWWTSTRSSGTR